MIVLCFLKCMPACLWAAHAPACIQLEPAFTQLCEKRRHGQESFSRVRQKCEAPRIHVANCTWSAHGCISVAWVWVVHVCSEERRSETDPEGPKLAAGLGTYALTFPANRSRAK